MAEGKLGAGYLAAKLNRPILPAGLSGTEDKAVGDNLKHFRRSHIRVIGGKTFLASTLAHERPRRGAQTIHRRDHVSHRR